MLIIDWHVLWGFLCAFSLSLKSSLYRPLWPRWSNTPLVSPDCSLTLFVLITQSMFSLSLNSLGGIHRRTCNVFSTHSSIDVSLGFASAGGCKPDMRTVFPSSIDQSVIRSWLLMLPLRLRVLTTNLIMLGSWLHPPPLRQWVLSVSRSFTTLRFLLPPLRYRAIFQVLEPFSPS